jgi:hypothetical protein
LIAHLNWIYTTRNEIANDFAFLSGAVIHDTEASELEKHAVDVAKKYVSDLNGYESSAEIKSFKYIGATTQKTAVFVLIAVRISNPTYYMIIH